MQPFDVLHLGFSCLWDTSCPHERVVVSEVVSAVFTDVDLSWVSLGRRSARFVDGPAFAVCPRGCSWDRKEWLTFPHP